MEGHLQRHGEMKTHYFAETGELGWIRKVSMRCLSCEMENFWRILSLTGMVPSSLDDWQQHEGRLARCAPNCAGLHTRSWWESEWSHWRRWGADKIHFKQSQSETVISCVREVESKCCGCIWNDFTVGYWYYSEYQKGVLSKRSWKQIDFGGICWYAFGEDELVVNTAISTHFKASPHWKV